jgi:hypothetical protein
MIDSMQTRARNLAADAAEYIGVSGTILRSEGRCVPTKHGFTNFIYMDRYTTRNYATTSPTRIKN